MSLSFGAGERSDGGKGLFNGSFLSGSGHRRGIFDSNGPEFETLNGGNNRLRTGNTEDFFGNVWKSMEDVHFISIYFYFLNKFCTK